jgi:hypothetical protein
MTKREVDEAIAVMRKSARRDLRSKKTAKAFLVKYGFITEDGKLTKRYGG